MLEMSNLERSLWNNIKIVFIIIVIKIGLLGLVILIGKGVLKYLIILIFNFK